MTSESAPARPDLLDNTVMRRIGYRVSRLCRKYGLAREDGEDLQQEFSLAVVRAAQIYDPKLCPTDRYVGMVLNGCYKNLVRKLSRAVDNRSRSVRAAAMDMSESESQQFLVDPNSKRDLHQMEVSEDVLTIVASLPGDLQETCRLLMSHSPPQVAKRQGVHPSTVYRDIAKLREHFRKAGFNGIFQI